MGPKLKLFIHIGSRTGGSGKVPCTFSYSLNSFQPRELLPKVQLIKLKLKIKKMKTTLKTRRFLHIGPKQCAPHAFQMTHLLLLCWERKMDAPEGTSSRLLFPQASPSDPSTPKPVVSAIATSFAAATIASSACLAAALAPATFENSPCSRLCVHV